MIEPSQDTPTAALGLPDQPLPPRWSLSTAGLDIFWPILAVVLTGAVVFVASVAHSSMESVGVPVSQNRTQTPRPTAVVVADKPLLIVQVSSHTTRSAAQAASQEMIGRGIPTKILKSDNYSPLNRGYYVVFTGPYTTTTVGRTDARRVQSRIPGALLRDIRPRATATPGSR